MQPRWHWPSASAKPLLPSIPVGDQMIGISVSIGLVELAAKDISLDSVMRRADLAMYQAKERGRNRVVSSFEPA
jgi:diguanylate cyclase (GGDEF)-like protein